MNLQSAQKLTFSFLMVVLGYTEANAANLSHLRLSLPAESRRRIEQAAGQGDSTALIKEVSQTRFAQLVGIPDDIAIQLPKIDPGSTKYSPDEIEFSELAANMKFWLSDKTDHEIAQRLGVDVDTFRLGVLRYRIARSEFFYEKMLQETPLQSVQTFKYEYLASVLVHYRYSLDRMKSTSLARELGISIHAYNRYVKRLQLNDITATRLRPLVKRPEIEPLLKVVFGYIQQAAKERRITLEAQLKPAEVEYYKFAELIGVSYKTLMSALVYEPISDKNLTQRPIPVIN